MGRLRLRDSRKTTNWLVCAAVCILAALAAGTVARAKSHGIATDLGPQIVQVYHQGQLVKLEIAPAQGHHLLTIGPWRFGPRVAPSKPSDKHPNLYVVIPGSQYHADGWDDYDHNLLISYAPHSGIVNFDVYWAIVLDPKLRENFQSEETLLMAAQQTFRPNDVFSFDDIPGGVVLQRVLKIDDVQDLKQRYQRSGGRLPRLIITPASAVVRASNASEEEAQPAQ